MESGQTQNESVIQEEIKSIAREDRKTGGIVKIGCQKVLINNYYIFTQNKEGEIMALGKKRYLQIKTQ